MDEPKVDEIMDIVVDKLTGLTTTGSNIKRSRVYPWQEDELPAISIYMGQDTMIDELQSGFLDWDLNVAVEIYVQENDDIDRRMNVVRREVHNAIMTDPQQGLSYVINTVAIGANEPILSDSAQQPIASQRLDFVIKYRTSRIDI